MLHNTTKLIFAASILSAFATVSLSAQAPPSQLHLQMRAANSSGTVLNGPQNVTISIYNVQAGGSPLWQENQVATATNGVINLLLGSTTTIPAGLFDASPLYVGVKIGADAEMTPRRQLASVPFATRAGKVSSVDATTTIAGGIVNSTHILDGTIAAADLAPGAINSAAIAPGAVTSTTIMNGAVTTAALANNAVAAVNIAAGAVGSTQILDDSVSLDDLQFPMQHPNGFLWVQTQGNYAILGDTSVSSSASKSGIIGLTWSQTGSGVQGINLSATGANNGVYGKTQSSTGIGVKAESTSTSGANYGLYATTASGSGEAVYAENLAGGIALRSYSSGTSIYTNGNVGLSAQGIDSGIIAGGANVGINASANFSTGKGVVSTGDIGILTIGNSYGLQSVSNDIGVTSSAQSTAFEAVSGNIGFRAAPGTYNIGFQSENQSIGFHSVSSSTGVKVESAQTGADINGSLYGVLATSGTVGVKGTGPVGIYGESSDTSGDAVKGFALATTGSAWGVRGQSASNSGIGVYASNTNTAGTTYGVQGNVSSLLGYGVYSNGKFAATGTKSFIQPHPLDATKEIHYVCLEGNESGTYFRGTGVLQNGKATITVPEDFRFVSEAEGMTVQLTPVGRATLWVENENLQAVEVAGDRDVKFHYFVQSVRRGFRSHQVIQENRSFVPEVRGAAFGTQYPAELRQILVENGTLNADFTPNEANATKNGWTLRDADQPEKK